LNRLSLGFKQLENRIQLRDVQQLSNPGCRPEQLHVAATVPRYRIDPAQLSQSGVIQISDVGKADYKISVAALNELPGELPQLLFEHG